LKNTLVFFVSFDAAMLQYNDVVDCCFRVDVTRCDTR